MILSNFLVLVRSDFDDDEWPRPADSFNQTLEYGVVKSFRINFDDGWIQFERVDWNKVAMECFDFFQTALCADTVES